MNDKTFTLRMPIGLFSEVETHKRKSITEFVLQAIEEKLARERDEDLKRGFESLGVDFDDSDFQLWGSLQQKAMAHVDD